MAGARCVSDCQSLGFWQVVQVWTGVVVAAQSTFSKKWPRASQPDVSLAAWMIGQILINAASTLSSVSKSIDSVSTLLTRLSLSAIELLFAARSAVSAQMNSAPIRMPFSSRVVTRYPKVLFINPRSRLRWQAGLPPCYVNDQTDKGNLSQSWHIVKMCDTILYEIGQKS